MFKKVLSLLLALLMLSMAFVACGKGSEDDENADELSDTNEYELDFSDRDYGGHEFTVLRPLAESQHKIEGAAPNDIYVDEMGSDPLSNAVYTRNQILEQQLNVKIVMSMEKDGPRTVELLNTNVLSGDKPYDMIDQMMEFFPHLINQGLIQDMSVLNLDTSYSWWDSKAENAFEFMGKKYGMVSDITYLDKLSTVGVFFNTSMATELGMPDLYSMVDNGEWTYEEMKKYAIMASNSGEEVYGVSCQNDASYFFLHSANIKTVVETADGSLGYTLSTQRPVDALGEIFTLMNQDYFYNRQKYNASVDDTAKMFNEQVLFLVRPIFTFYFLKNYTSDYGILPMPKFDDVNEGYYSPINHHVATFISIPKNNSEYERTADVLQAWGMISQKTVMGELYDRVLSAKYVNDEQSAEMINIILDNRVYDIGFIWDFGGIEGTLVLSNVKMIEKAPETIGSTVVSLKQAVLASIKATQEAHTKSE